MALLDLADRVKRGEISGGLERKILAMVFMDPSLRTRASFEAAMFLHGGHGIVLEPGKGSWSLETEPGAVMDGATVEHIKDAARVLGRYADVLGVRTFPRPGNWDTVRQDLVIRRFAEYCEKPIINLESTRRHPCQGLADAHDAAGEVRRRSPRQAVRAPLGLASQGAADGGAGQCRDLGGNAGHGGRDRTSG